MPIALALLFIVSIHLTDTPAPAELAQEPTGKQIAESLGYRTGPPGWQEVDMTDPYIVRRLHDQ